MSITLSLTGTSSVLTANYFPPIRLSKDYERCLVDFHSYNSIPNVDCDNNLFHIGGSVIKIPVGSYEMEDIVDFITKVYKKINLNKSIDIKPNNNTLQIKIFSSHDEINFNETSSIGRLFGFSEQILKPGIIHTSNLPVNILRVNALQIKTNITTGSYMNSLPAHILYELGVNVPPGYKLDATINNLIYLPLISNEISTLKVWIVDQEGRLINFRGEEITLRLHLRPRAQ